MKKLIFLSLFFTYFHVYSSESQEDAFENSSLMEMSSEISKMVDKLNLKVKNVAGKRIVTVDSDQNGKPEIESIYINGKIFREKIDFDQDGDFDKVDIYFQSGNNFHITTLDTNNDNKVDVKIVRSRKASKNGYYSRVRYVDRDKDGVFDSKKSKEVSYLQHQHSRDDDCGECDSKAWSKVHLPGILENRYTSILNELTYDMSRTYREGSKLTFRFEIQNSCLDESNPDKELYSQAVLMQAMMTGLSCLGKLPGNMAKRNFIKAVEGLIGAKGGLPIAGSREDLVRGASKRVKLLCTSTPEQVAWDVGNTVRFGYATTGPFSKPSHNKFNSVADHPYIVFRPNLVKALRAKRSHIGGYTDQFKALVFHEYLHTALGTSHEEDEVDYATACENYCFADTRNQDDKSKKIRESAKRICSGEYVETSEAYKKDLETIKSF